MGRRPEHDGVSQPGPKAVVPHAESGVRTEHQLRVQLRQALERNTTFERALRASAAYAYGPRDLADLRRLRAVLSAAGFPDPNARRGHDDPGESEPPADGG